MRRGHSNALSSHPTAGTGQSSAQWLMGKHLPVAPHTSRFGDTGSKATYWGDLASQNLHLASETAENANPASLSMWGHQVTGLACDSPSPQLCGGCSPETRST